jgi:hypothetical protein
LRLFEVKQHRARFNEQRKKEKAKAIETEMRDSTLVTTAHMAATHVASADSQQWAIDLASNRKDGTTSKRAPLTLN